MGRAVILVLDNRDSYTYNLVQLLRGLTCLEVRVVSADDRDEALRLLDSGEVQGVVISPGPGHPDEAADFAASGSVIDAVLATEPAVPMLGVCLGHQGLARRFGYEVVAAPQPQHGWRSPLTHDGTGLFAGIPADTRVTRYHSLAVVPGAAPSPRLRVTSRSEDDVIQAFEIEGAPWYGVQFHPESIASVDGERLLANFVRVVEGRAAALGESVASPERDAVPAHTLAHDPGAAAGASHSIVPTDLHLATRHLQLHDLGLSAREAAHAIASRVLVRGRGSFWFESAMVDAAESRWSLLGDASDAAGDGAACVVRFRLADAPDTPEPGAVASHGWRDSWAADAPVGSAPERLSFECPDPFAWLEAEQRRVRPVGGEGLPFRGGRLGYFGYELGLRDLGVDAPRAATPDACWIRPSRFIAIDNVEGVLTVCVASEDRERAEAGVERELVTVRETLEAAAAVVATSAPAQADEADAARASEHTIAGSWRVSRAEYAEQIEACRAALVAGDSYELCLTTSFSPDGDVRMDPLALFDDLTANHPAPYAALVEFDDDGEPVAIVSASPERYLRGRDDRYETKPIKGTAARHDDPEEDARAAAALATDPKTFAENLMIVDLLRNDLGRVCRPGTVEVPALMRVESYASLHQLVSTIVGVAEPGVTPVGVARALFPGGSMTGAPKRRSVEILAGLEAAARGVYSGSLGWFSADGQTELSIVIRTAVLAGGRWSIGAGGAIVLASDAEAEADEVLLKSLALRRAMARVSTR